MKKFLFVAISIIIGFASLFAYSEDVKDRSGKVVGNVTWTYSIKTHGTRDGSFTTVKATNNSNEYVTISFKTNAGGYARINLPPYESDECIIGTNKVATSVHCLGVTRY